MILDKKSSLKRITPVVIILLFFLIIFVDAGGYTTYPPQFLSNNTKKILNPSFEIEHLISLGMPNDWVWVTDVCGSGDCFDGSREQTYPTHESWDIQIIQFDQDQPEEIYSKSSFSQGGVDLTNVFLFEFDNRFFQGEVGDGGLVANVTLYIGGDNVWHQTGTASTWYGVNNTNISVISYTGVQEINFTMTSLVLGGNVLYDFPAEWYVDNIRLWGNNESVHTVPVINTTYAQNYTQENITCYIKGATDPDGDDIMNTTAWYEGEDDEPYASLLFTFDLNTSIDGISAKSVKDYSGWKNNGTITADVIADDVSWTQNGYQGGAYNFSGTDAYISFSKTAPLTPNGDEITVAMRYKGNGDTESSLFHYGGTTQGYGIMINDNNLSGAVYIDSTQYKVNYSYDMSNGSWYHVALRINSTALSLFLQGEEVAVTASDGYMVANPAGSVRLGDSNNVYKTNLDRGEGLFDDFIHVSGNYPVSNEQIKSWYERGFDRIVQQETMGGELWKCGITISDGWHDSVQKNSTSLYVLNNLTEQDTPILNSTLNKNTTVENLTLYPNNLVEPNGENIFNYTFWYKDGSGYNLLEMSFDEKVDVIDNLLPNYLGNDFKYKGNPIWRTYGCISGGCYDFDGTGDYFDMGTGGTIDASTTAYIEAWVKPDAVGADNGDTIYEEGGTGAGYWLHVDEGDSHVSFGIRESSSSAENVTYDNNNLNAGVWQHIVGIWNTSDLILWVNGSMVAYINTTIDSVGNPSDAPIIGTSSNNPYRGGTLSGWLDNLRVGENIPTNEQIVMNYQTGRFTLDSSQTEIGDVWKGGVVVGDGANYSISNSSAMTILSSDCLPVTGWIINRTCTFVNEIVTAVDTLKLESNGTFNLINSTFDLNLKTYWIYLHQSAKLRLGNGSIIY